MLPPLQQTLRHSQVLYYCPPLKLFQFEYLLGELLQASLTVQMLVSMFELVLLLSLSYSIPVD